MNEIIHTGYGYDLQRTPDGLNFEVLDETHDQPATPVDARMTMAQIRALIGDPNVYQEHIATMRGVAYVIRAYVTLGERDGMPEQWTGFLAVWEGDGPRPTAKTTYPTRRWDLPEGATVAVSNALQETVLRDMVADVVQSMRDNES